MAVQTGTREDLGAFVHRLRRSTEALSISGLTVRLFAAPEAVATP